MSDQTRALRNCNPLNLRPSGDNWDGLRPQQTDPGFLQFISNYHGLRAGAKNLITYYRVHGRDTVHDIIASWAPPSDNNDTESYTRHVSSALEVYPKQKLNLDNGDTLRRLMEAMIQIEAGSQPFSKIEIETAINAAYASHRAPPRVVTVVPTPEPSPMPPGTPSAPPQPPPSPLHPPLVNQPTGAPTRKVLAGGIAGAVAFMLMVMWNKAFPEAPIPAEYATAIGGAVVYAATLVTQYVVKNRATDEPSCTDDTPPGGQS